MRGIGAPAQLAVTQEHPKRKEDEHMADNKRPGYAGSIQNTGAQKVNAPFSQNVKKGNGQVKTGNDLRTGSSGSGKSGK